MKIRSMIAGMVGMVVMCGGMALLSCSSTAASASTAERASPSEVSQLHTVGAFDPSEAAAKPLRLIGKQTCPNKFMICRKSGGTAAQ